ncbi:sugar kinase [Streptomyces cucumeris]|uniref:sugar kinase n=1 Tax=Streptomyces cucumeris TaxID=2962890 RepID=UPI003D74C6A0
MDVFTLGEAMVCFSPTTGLLDAAAHLGCSVGGAELNTAIGLSRLGHHVQWTSRVSTDPLGSRLLAVLEAEGLATNRIRRSPDLPTGLMLKDRPTTEARVLYYRRGSAASALTAEDVDEDAVSSARFVHLTGITPALGPGPAAAAERALAIAGAAAVPVSFDPNFRPQLWNERQAAALYRRLLPSVDHLLCNEAEARLITGHQDLDRAVSALADSGPRHVIVKRSADGVTALCDGEQVRVPAWHVSDLVDSVGAGDAFNAGWLHSRLTGLGVRTGLRLAAFAAAQVVRHAGDYEGFPSATHIADWLAEHDRQPDPAPPQR